MRCASPPESVPALLPRVRYSNPTFSMNLRRFLISRNGTSATSRKRFSSVFSSFSNKVYASCTESSAICAIFLPSISTLKLSSRKRLPIHVSQTSSDQRSLVPNPWQAGHAPCGLLNEKRRGSISGNENSSFGQENFPESEISLSAAAVTTSCPYFRALSAASARRRRVSLKLKSIPEGILSTTSSIVCSL